MTPIPYRPGGQSTYQLSGEWTENDVKNISGSTQRDLTSVNTGEGTHYPGEKYQLGETINGQTYCYDAGEVSIGDALRLPEVFYRPNVSYDFYIGGIWDQFNDENGRDIEPSRGDLKDHYYYLLVNYVRKYKGVRPIPDPSDPITIDLSAGQDVWQNVAPYYAAYIGNTGDRDAFGYGKIHYTEASGRNDIIGAQVARDNDYLYFRVECKDNITPYTDKLWMNLLIDSNQENSGWNSFDFVVNKSPASASTVVLERFTGSGYGTEKVADCEYAVDGRYMTVKVSKSDIGVSGDKYTVNFSWTDNVHDVDDAGTADADGNLVYNSFSGDIMEFYVSGDVAPGGRFKYSYAVGQEKRVDPNGGNKSDGDGKSGVNWLVIVIPVVLALGALTDAIVVVSKSKKNKAA